MAKKSYGASWEIDEDRTILEKFKKPNDINEIKNSDYGYDWTKRVIVEVFNSCRNTTLNDVCKHIAETVGRDYPCSIFWIIVVHKKKF